MLGISTLVIAFLYTHKGSAQVPNMKVRPPLEVKPAFYDKSPEDGLWEALIYYDVKFPEIVYAQAILETGHFKSRGCIRDNNLFGLYDSRKGRYHRFNHWTESVVKYKEWIQYRYRPPGDYYEFLRRIRYAKDPKYITKLKQIVKKHGKAKQNASTGHHQQVRKGI